MFARKREFTRRSRATAIATMIALALTGVAPSLAYAGAPRGNGVATPEGGVTDISARRRLAPGAAAAAAFAGIVGTGIAMWAPANVMQGSPRSRRRDI